MHETPATEKKALYKLTIGHVMGGVGRNNCSGVGRMYRDYCDYCDDCSYEYGVPQIPFVPFTCSREGLIPNEELLRTMLLNCWAFSG